MELFAKNEFEQVMFFSFNKIVFKKVHQQKLKVQKKIEKLAKKISSNNGT